MVSTDLDGRYRARSWGRLGFDGARMLPEVLFMLNVDVTMR